MQIIFSGPTISHCEAHKILAVEYRPPAKRGDIYAATLARPQAIGIIDGYFENMPSVWHKEILWALKEGIQVWGCSSMGALRAVELEAFGMRGFGEIFTSFQRGELNDDDEVALIHGPAESGYIACSEALVNIRATIKVAQEKQFISSTIAESLLLIAKQLHYRNRSYENIVMVAQQQSLPQQAVDQFAQFSAEHAINQKRLDAIAMLKEMAKQEQLSALSPTFYFEHSDNWQQLVNQINNEMLAEINADETDDLFEEIKLCQRYASLRQQALTRRLGLELAQDHHVVIDEQKLSETLEVFCHKRGLLKDNTVDFDALSHWYGQQQLSLQAFDTLMKNEAKLGWVNNMYAQNLQLEMLECLRLSGEYAVYQARSREKQQSMRNCAKQALSDEDLWYWYFTVCLNRKVPRNLNKFAHHSGFDSIAELRDAVFKEYVFIQLKLKQNQKQPVS